MGTLLGPWRVYKHSSQTVLLLLSSKIPPFSSPQKQAGGQCGDVWWGGPPLLQGRAQLGTIDWSRRLESTHWPVSLFLWGSPSDAPTTVHGHRQTHTNTFSDTQSHRHIHHSQWHRQTHRHMETHKQTYKHTQRHIKTCIASQRHTNPHRDTYKQTHKHIDTQTTHWVIIPRPSEKDSDQGPKSVQRSLCSWERAAPTAL